MRCYRRNPQIAARVIDGQAFVVTPDDNRLHTLNETATCLWRLSQTGMTADAAATALTEEFEIDLETARRDAERCLEDLVTRQILVVETT
jgi:hypothetical protein